MYSLNLKPGELANYIATKKINTSDYEKNIN